MDDPEANASPPKLMTPSCARAGTHVKFDRTIEINSGAKSLTAILVSGIEGADSIPLPNSTRFDRHQ
jgi:hypothetical protein